MADVLTKLVNGWPMKVLDALPRPGLIGAK